MKKGIIVVVTLLTLALGGSLIQKNNRQMLLAEEEMNYLFEEDFSSPKPEYSDVFIIEEGLAYPIADSSRQKAWTKNFLPEEKVSSNNYSVSFDMKLLTTENVGLLKVNCIIDGVTSPFAYVNVKVREVSSSEPQQSSDTSHPTSEKEGKGSGCSGSVTTMASITSLSAILGIYFLLFKKKEEK
ncbi:MAG TPA: hypothetical protein GX010_01515 [Erysipelotrichaceae bacterium]|nr:hypothetical protein [Erysipelotrichaceae bacterium]